MLLWLLAKYTGKTTGNTCFFIPRYFQSPLFQSPSVIHLNTYNAHRAIFPINSPFFSCSFCPSKTYKREEIRSGHSMYLGNRCIAATNRTKTYIHKLALQEGKWPEAWTPSLHFQREQSYFPFFPGCEMTVLLLIPSGNRGFVSQLSHWL